MNANFENMAGQRILILVPHPDDEIVGVAAAIARARAGGARVFALYLSHGCLAQKTMWPWQQKYYAQIVSNRLSEAKKVAEFLSFSVIGDTPRRAAREIWPNLKAVESNIQEAIQSCAPSHIWVPAYEGGNPDHDGLNALAYVLSARWPAIQFYEFAEYHMAGGVFKANQFITMRGDEMVLQLSENERKMKADAFALYASEKDNLIYFRKDSFGVPQEMLRLLKGYDYLRPPHAGVLWYAQYQWVPFKHPRVDFTKPAQVCAAIKDYLAGS